MQPPTACWSTTVPATPGHYWILKRLNAHQAQMIVVEVLDEEYAVFPGLAGPHRLEELRDQGLEWWPVALTPPRAP